jgi:hypothetical protein
MKWEEKARAVQRADRCELNSLEGGWIVRRKFNVEAKENLAAVRDGMEFDEAGNPVKIRPGAIKDFHKLVLKAGLLDSNFEDKDGKKVDVHDDAFLGKLLDEFPEVAQEMVDAIMEFNSPLPSGSSSNSETVPSGTSAGEGSSGQG